MIKGEKKILRTCNCSSNDSMCLKMFGNPPSVAFHLPLFKEPPPPWNDRAFVVWSALVWSSVVPTGHTQFSVIPQLTLLPQSSLWEFLQPLLFVGNTFLHFKAQPGLSLLYLLLLQRAVPASGVMRASPLALIWHFHCAMKWSWAPCSQDYLFSSVWSSTW